MRQAISARARGRSIGEYALILGLVALAAIPALTLLSGSMKDILSKSGDRSQAGELFALLDMRSKGAPPATPSKTTLQSAGFKPSPLLGASNPTLAALETNGGKVEMYADARGRLVIKANGMPLGGAQDSTGAQGGVLMTTLMADQLLQLADELQQEGEDGELIAQLRAHAASGHNLASVESSVNQAVKTGDTRALTEGEKFALGSYYNKNNPLKFQGDPANGNQLPPIALALQKNQVGNLADLYMGVNDAFYASQAALLQRLAKRSDARAQKAKARVEAYGGAILQVADRHYTKSQTTFYQSLPEGGVQPYSMSPPPDADSYQAMIIDTSKVTVDITPAFTHVASDQIPGGAGAPAPKAGEGVASNYAAAALPNN